MEEQQKHPIILSVKDRYTKLLFSHYHLELMHGVPTAILSHSGNMFFVTGGRRLAREICRSCITFREAAAKTGPQLMGQLPPDRVTPDIVFHTTGLDYAGPYLLKEGYVRRPVEIKAWMAVFVCFCTKAVHLELVKDATAASLIACLNRFCSRRGRPNIISTGFRNPRHHSISSPKPKGPVETNPSQGSSFWGALGSCRKSSQVSFKKGNRAQSLYV